MKNIAVVILNWKGTNDTIDCLHSLCEQEEPRGLRFVVIDNASGDDSLENIRCWAKARGVPFKEIDYCAADDRLLPIEAATHAKEQRLTLVRSDENTGFCVGNNLGAQIGFNAGADYVLVLNNDTVVGRSFNAELQAALTHDDGTTLYSPQIAYANSPDTVWWFGGRFSRLLAVTYLDQGKPLRIIDDGCQPETQWVSGCATLISHRLYQRLGLYDPIFFIWCEEWDLSLRAARAGVSMRILPRVLVYHKVGKSLGITSPLTFFYAMRNMLILRRRYLPLLFRLPFNLVYLPHKLIQAVTFSLQQRDWSYLRGCLDALSSTHTGGKWRGQDQT